MCEKEEGCYSCYYTCAFFISIFAIYYLKKFFNGGICNIKNNQQGKVFIVTGSNTGIGRETAKYIADLNGTVILANRSLERTQSLLNELQEKYGKERVQYIRLDLSDLESVKQFASDFKSKYQRLDVLINNAGLCMLPQRKETKQGFEMHFGTNHLGHFLLTGLLMDVLKKTQESRVINVSALAGKQKKWIVNFEDVMAKKSYDPIFAYAQSKVCNDMFAKYLQSKFNEKNINCKAVSLHPGVVRTDIARYIANNTFKKILFNHILPPALTLITKNSFQGAQTTIQCALEAFDKLSGGGYYRDCKLDKSGQYVSEMSNQKRLFELSEELVDFKFSF